MADPSRRSRHLNRDGIVVFPGVDLKRSVDLKEFLYRPIDSRDPFAVPDSPKSRITPGLKTIVPPEELKKEWDERLDRIRTHTRQSRRKPVNIGLPNIAIRELRKSSGDRKPLNSPTTESVTTARSALAEDPAFANSKLPKLRMVPQEYARARARPLVTLF
jgi:hypothetical protein